VKVKILSSVIVEIAKQEILKIDKKREELYLRELEIMKIPEPFFGRLLTWVFCKSLSLAEKDRGARDYAFGFQEDRKKRLKRYVWMCGHQDYVEADENDCKILGI